MSRPSPGGRRRGGSTSGPQGRSLLPGRSHDAPKALPRPFLSQSVRVRRCLAPSFLPSTILAQPAREIAHPRGFDSPSEPCRKKARGRSEGAGHCSKERRTMPESTETRGWSDKESERVSPGSSHRDSRNIRLSGLTNHLTGGAFAGHTTERRVRPNHKRWKVFLPKLPQISN